MVKLARNHDLQQTQKVIAKHLAKNKMKKILKNKMKLISIYIVINISMNQLKKIVSCLKLLWVKVMRIHQSIFMNI